MEPRLGIALQPLLEDDEALVEQALLAYQKTFEFEGARRSTPKLGLTPRDEAVELTHTLFSFRSKQETRPDDFLPRPGRSRGGRQAARVP